MRVVTCVSVAVALLLTLVLNQPQGVLAAGGLHVVSDEGESLEGDGGVPAVESVPMPRHVVAATEGTMWKLRERNDVVVVGVTQSYDCPSCASMLKHFATAAANFSDAKTGTVQFALLDAVEEADEYSLLVDEHPDFHWLVPAILVLKREYQKVYRRPPFSFLLNENTGRDLPRFVKRLLGPDIVPIKSEDALVARIHDDATERVSFTIWPWFTPARKAVERVVSEKRLHSYFTHVVDSPLLASDEFVDRHNPKGDAITAHIVRSDGTVEVHGTMLERSTDFTRQVALLREFIEQHKLRRPGHENDETKSIETEDLVPGGTCDGQRVTKNGDRVVVSGTGVNQHTGSEFLAFSYETVVVGKERPDLPPGIAASAFMDLCPPAKRKLVLPARKHYSNDGAPPGVDEDDIVRFEFELHEFATGSGSTGSGDAPPPRMTDAQIEALRAAQHQDF